MRNLLCAVALLSLGLFGAGCKKASPLIGKWSAAAGSTTVSYEFTDANAFTMSLGSMMTVKGDYKLDGEKLTMNVKDFDMQGITPQAKEQAKKAGGMDKPLDMTVKFVSDDEISLTGATAGMPAGAMTLKRVKAGA